MNFTLSVNMTETHPIHGYGTVINPYTEFFEQIPSSESPATCGPAWDLVPKPEVEVSIRSLR